MKNSVKGSISLLIAVIIWGTTFIAQSVGVELIGPFTFQVIRCGMAVLFLIPLTLLMELRSVGFKASILRWFDQKLWKGGMICGLALFVAANLQQIGLIYTDAGKAGFITAMYIVLVPILGLFLKQKPPRTAIAGVVLAVVGLYLLSCTGASGINIGDLCIMGCALAFAVQILCVDRFASSLDGLRLNCVQALVVTVVSIPFMATETIVMADILNCWFPLAYAGVLSMGVAYSLQIIGQKHMSPTPASLIMSLESVIAAVSGWLLLNERMTTPELIGCCLVFAAVILSQLPDKKR